MELLDLSAQHANDLLLVHERGSNSIFVVDIYSPGNGVPFEPQPVDDVIVSFGIPTDDLLILGGHGGEVHGYSDLQTFL